MISLTDAQLDVVCRVARDLPPEKRSVYLERVAAIPQRPAVYPNLIDVLEAAAGATEPDRAA